MLDVLKTYIEKRIELLKVETTEKSIKVASITIYVSIIMLIGLFLFIFLSLGLGLLIGDWLGNHTYGVLIIAGLCLIKLIVFIAFRKSIINKLINFLLKIT